MATKKKASKQETKEDGVHSLELRKTAPDSEFDTDFIERMLFHMGGRSLERYGEIRKRYPEEDQALPHIMERFTKYLYTRNRKFLIDAANFTMIEFMHPCIEGSFFESTDSDASPGRIFDGGDQSAGRNTDAEQAIVQKPTATIISIQTGTPITEYSPLFLQGMINRMSVSYMKYGAVRDGYPFNVNAPESMALRTDRYIQSRNTEFLMDVANFCMIENMYPSLVKTHYNPIADMSSAGQVALKAAAKPPK